MKTITTTMPANEINEILKNIDERACEIMDDEENEDNWLALKSCREVFNSINKAHKADCGFTLYSAANEASVWLAQAEKFLTSECI